jgi:hypothetical protein
MKGQKMSFKNPNKLKKSKIIIKKVTAKPAKGISVAKVPDKHQYMENI